MMSQFVIQEHHARTHHFDFRLEKDGVFKSWAIPKGIPDQPGVKRLAVQVEDHDLVFGDFEGQIPEGHYGAGQVKVWDHGQVAYEEWLPNRITFTLYGGRVHGRFHLIRFRRGGPQDWLVYQSAAAAPPPPKEAGFCGKVKAA